MSQTKPLDLSELLKLPVTMLSQPRTVALLSSELRKPEPSLRRLCQLFGTDPALAARLLTAANGMAHLMGQRVTGIPEALVVLMPLQLRQIVQKAPLGLGSGAVPGFDLAAFWRYSIQTAKLARALAASVQANASAAYALGLIHGLGELHLHSADPHQSARLGGVLPPFHPRRAQMEQRLSGYAYSAVSAGLARSWNFPPALVDALQYMHAPLEQAMFEPLTGVLHLAAWRVSTQTVQWSERELAVSFPAEVGLALGMDIDMVLRQASIDWHTVNELDVSL